MRLKNSELILNPDGSIYHLNLKPENISTDLIFVGDPDRVDKVTQHFDTIEFSTHKREFKTTTGTYKGKRVSVILTGIGADNIDIVFHEFIIDEKQIVRFPSNMGISGYALHGDAVCFINDFAHKKATVIGPLQSNTSSSRHQVLTLAQ